MRSSSNRARAAGRPSGDGRPGFLHVPAPRSVPQPVNPTERWV